MFIQEQIGSKVILVKSILWIGYFKLDSNLKAIFKSFFRNLYFLHEEPCGSLDGVLQENISFKEYLDCQQQHIPLPALPLYKIMLKLLCLFSIKL